MNSKRLLHICILVLILRKTYMPLHDGACVPNNAPSHARHHDSLPVPRYDKQIQKKGCRQPLFSKGTRNWDARNLLEDTLFAQKTAGMSSQRKTETNAIIRLHLSFNYISLQQAS